MDTTKTHALLERLPRIPRRFGYYAVLGILLLLIFGCFLGGTGATMKALGTIGWNGAIVSVLALVVGGVLAYGVMKVISFIVRAIGGDFADWYDIAAARWDARLQDHRLAMVFAGLFTLLLSVVLFGTLPQSFFPPQNSDYSQVHITLAPGSTCLLYTSDAADE